MSTVAPNSAQSQPAASANGTVPVGIPNHSRKGSLMVGGGLEIQRGNLAFGTVDIPNPLLSSSPAAPSMTGTHLNDAVKSFGSIDADASTDPSAVMGQRRASNTTSPVTGGNKQLNAHSLFTGKPNLNGNSPSMQSASPNVRPPPTFQHAHNGAPQHIRPQGPPSFRPQQMNGAPQSAFVRPTQSPNMQPNMQRMGGMPQYSMHGGPQGGYPVMGYPGQGYYDGYNNYPPQYGMAPQWAPPQHQMPISPRVAPGQTQSPNPQSASLPHSGGGSPVPTPHVRPPSLMHQASSSSSIPALPSTPSRPLMASTSSNHSLANLSVGAATFTPRASKALKITRPDGTEVDFKSVAAAAKAPATPSSSGIATPEPAEGEPPKKKMPTLPVIVRIESEDQKKQRLEEEQRQARIKKEEEREEEERKERKERLAREEKEREAKAAQDKEKKEAEAKEAEEKQKAEAAKAAEVAATKKADDDKRAVEEAAAAAAQKEKDEAAKAQAAEESSKAGSAPEAATPEPEPVPSSPAVGTADLPPKPVAAAVPKKAAPPPLDVKSTPDLSSSALSSAKPIEDIKSIVYPAELKSPRAELNVDAEPGKFRYDRDFLMQFMNVCKEKPENLPPLEEIGLEAESSSSGFGRGGGRGSRSSGPSRGGPPIGLGIGGSRQGFPAQGMGSFNMGMGNFGSTRGTTSEERMLKSVSGHNRMARTPSAGLPAMSLSGSRSGANRSRGGMKRPSQIPAEPDVAPLVVSTNSWVKSRPTGDDEGSPAFIERKVKALLNKLTAEKFDSIAGQILEWANKSAHESDGMTLKLVIKQIFEKATDEAHWSEMYARLCKLLLERLDPAITETLDGKDVSGGALFRKYLVGRCQFDFEAGWKAREDAANAAAAKSEEDKERLESQKDQENAEAVMLSDEYYIAQKAKRRGLGLIQLIGELYKLDMLGKGVIRQCFLNLLKNLQVPDEEDIESACKLLTTVGRSFERASPESMEIVFSRLQIITEAENVPSRIRFMIMDVIDLRRVGWQSKKGPGGVMTIAEVHQQAAKEQAEKSAAARESISRGGSKTGYSRNGPQPGEWQSVAAGARQLPQRPSDFSKIGLNSASTQSGPSFGPSSVFSKNRKAGGTPPLSRQPSTATLPQSNAFSLLQAETEAAAAAPERKKLNLQPRTKPVESEQADQAEEESEEEEEVATPSVGMTEHGAKLKLETDMKELWGEKDMGGSRNPDDIVEYFKSLPEEHRGLLAKRLVDDVFRLSKTKDAEVVGSGWSAAVEQTAVSKETLIKTLETRMTSLDDDAIDFPQAYKAIAILIRHLSLSDDEIEALGKKVDVYGEPKITPQMKLERALKQVDDEASA